MDVSSLLSVLPAPRAVLDRLPTHRHRVRFQVRSGDGWLPVTWGQYATQIRGVARWLVEHDIEPGDRIAIFAANSVAWASACLGIQTAGAVFVPIYPASTPDQVAYILEHSEAKYVLVDAALRGKLRGATPAVDIAGCAWSPDAGAGDGEFRDAAARDAAAPTLVDARLGALDLDAPGEMLYTSGTSGNPKGVPLTHRNVGTNGADWLACNAALLAEGDRDLLWLPMSHIFGFGELCAGNLLGWETYLATPQNVLDLLPGVAPQVFMSVPAYWEKIARAMSVGPDPSVALHRVTGGRLRFCLSGGAGLKVEIKQQLHAAGLLIIEGYGLTETSPTLTLNRPDAFRFDTVGKVLPSIEVKLAEDGEILARGPSVFSGYHKDPSATAQAFTDDGWLKTGDVGRFTDDGFLQIIDRKKDILVTAGGKNVPPVNIEQRFADDPFIAHLVVYGDGKRYLVAGVWLNQATVDAHLDANGAVANEARDAARRALVQQRIDRVTAELASYETIKTFAVLRQPLSVEGGLLTPTFKVRRKKVYEAFGAELEALYQKP